MDFNGLKERIEKYRPTVSNGYVSLPFVALVRDAPAVCWFNYYLKDHNEDTRDICIHDVFVAKDDDTASCLHHVRIIVRANKCFFGCYPEVPDTDNPDVFNAFCKKLQMVYRSSCFESKMSALMSLSVGDALFQAYKAVVNYLNDINSNTYDTDRDSRQIMFFKLTPDSEEVFAINNETVSNVFDELDDPYIVTSNFDPKKVHFFGVCPYCGNAIEIKNCLCIDPACSSQPYARHTHCAIKGIAPYDPNKLITCPHCI